MKRLIATILIAASVAQADPNTGVLFILRSNSNLPLWIQQGAKAPWQLADNGAGVMFAKWDTATLGTNAPSIDYLASIDAQAMAWWATYQYDVRQTPQWTNLVADINGYAPLKTNLVNSIDAVSDANTKAALNDAKAIIQQLQQEIRDLKHVIGVLNQYEN